MARHPQKGVESSRLSRGTLLAARLGLLAALGVDAYLAWRSFIGGGVAGCGPDSPCQTVLNSRWAYSFGVPVSLPALLVYAILLGESFRLGSNRPERDLRRTWGILVAGSVAVIGASLWFIGLQLFVLKAICPYCMTAHGAALFASTLLLKSVPVGRTSKKARRAGGPVPLARPQPARLSFVGGLGLAGLIIGQFLFQRQTYVSSPISAGVQASQTERSPRHFQLFDGRFEMDLKEVPLIGKPEASHVLLSLFDYTCRFCRQMHAPIMEAYRQFSNSLAIISLPMPLDSKCNHLMRFTPPEHRNACALARLGLIVWRADPAASRSYEDWIFGLSSPPEPAEAEAHARALVGSKRFEQAAADPWVAAQLQESISIYDAIYAKYRKGMLPELIIGTNLISGPFRKDRLFELLDQQFGIRAAP